MTTRAIIKSIIIGILASLVVSVMVSTGINTGKVPFNIPPAEAFLKVIGINSKILGMVLHFFYGTFADFAMLYLFKCRTYVRHGMLVAYIMWLIMMIIYSPIIGWGIFGYGSLNNSLAPNHPLYLGPPIKYIIATFVIHTVYGLVIGYLSSEFIGEEEYND